MMKMRMPVIIIMDNVSELMAVRGRGDGGETLARLQKTSAGQRGDANYSKITLHSGTLAIVLLVGATFRDRMRPRERNQS